MKSMLRNLALAAVMVIGSTVPAQALIVNGGFEAGFTGWTVASQIGSEGGFALQSGTLSPVTGFDVPPPPEGVTAAMTDAEGPGSHVLYQDFVVPAAVGPTILSFQLFIQNHAPDFVAPPHLDFATPALNQQARVDILLAASDAFSVAASDVLQNIYQTQPGDALIAGYSLHAVDVTALLNAHVGTPLRLRFAEVDNVFIFQFGVDAVSIGPAQVAPLAEPSALFLALAGALALGWSLRRRA
jgi:hypothetical protein